MRWFYVLAFIILWPISHLLYPMTTRGRENIPEGPCIICANHSNFIDPVLVVYACGIKCFLRCMSKQENMDKPFLGWFCRMCGAYGVRRGETDIGSVRDTMRVLRDGGKVLMFPEGTRVDEDWSVPAKTGAVRIARKMKVPLVPVYLSRGKRLFQRVRVVIGEAYHVSAAGHQEYSEQSDELLRRIVALGGV